MKNVKNRLSRLEQSIASAKPTALDWTQTRAYAQMTDEDRGRLHAYTTRFSAEGLSTFSDEELQDFEQLVFPFAKEEEEYDH